MSKNEVIGLDDITEENITKLQDEQRTNNEKAQAVAKPFYDAATKAATRLGDIRQYVSKTFEEHLRLIAGTKSKAPLYVNYITPNYNKEMQVSTGGNQPLNTQLCPAEFPG